MNHLNNWFIHGTWYAIFINAWFVMLCTRFWMWLFNDRR